MNQHQEFEGRDLGEAIRSAATGLGIAEEDLHYEVLDQGRRGLLGLGTRNVRIRVKPPIAALSNEQILKGEHLPRTPAPLENPPARGPRADVGRAARPPREPRPPLEPLPAATAEVVQTVQRMLDLSGLALTAAAAPGPSGMVLHFEGEDSKVFHHRRGELAAAYQFLLNRMARRAWPEIGRIQVAAEGGPADDREDKLVAMARDAAKQVARTGRPRRMPPMNAYERRLVHLVVRDFPGLTSISDGEGALKTVRITKIRNELEV